MIRWDITFIEVVAVVLFILGILQFQKHGTGRGVEYFMMAMYGLVLEALDMIIFKSYHYSGDFALTIFNVPICIALLWAVILAGSMAITDKLGLPAKVRPFMDAILAVWIDLALDAIAIRLEYWTWVIPLDEGWFGVPAGNLYAWMWVAFSYSFLARWVREKVKQNKKWIWAYLPLPILAYILLFVSMASVGILGEILNLKTQNQRLNIFYVQFLIFLFIVARVWSKREAQPAESMGSLKFWTWSRLFMHIYFLVAFVVMGTYRDVPMLGIVTVVIFLGELFFLNKLVNKFQLAKVKLQ